MKVRKTAILLLVLVMVAGALAACGNKDDGAGAGSGTDATGGRDPYTFSYYMNYDWYGVHKWGVDAISKHWQEKFNITADISKPDMNPDEAMSIIINSGNLPDAIWMERGALNMRMARMGLFVDLNTLKPMIEGNYYDDNITQNTQNMLKVDGVLYGIPNWSRKAASGGNEAWLYTQSVYNAVGSPKISTFEDLYAYACSVRDAQLRNPDGLPIIPVLVKNIDTSGGTHLVDTIYRCFGGPHKDGGWYGRVGTTYQFILRDPLWREAAMEANKWVREGLVDPTYFTDSLDQFLEKLTSARGGLIWYDQSQDDGNNFRRTVKETYGDSIELITFQEGGKTYLYPPAHGLSPEKIYAYHVTTVGWNVTCITTAAKKPERIFELVSYWLTKEGSIEMMYGPQGDVMWDEMDPTNSFPILKQSPDALSTAEQERLDLWFWTIASQSDNCDTVKFAANDALPPDQQSWVVTNQAHIFTPLMMPLTDEYLAIGDSIEPDTELAVRRTECEQYMQVQLVKILQATTQEEAERLYDEALAYVDSNGMKEIEAVYDVKYQENCALQGGTIYNR